MSLLLVSLTAYAQDTIPYLKEIKAFELKDQQSVPPRRPVLFVGSSSIRFWNNLSTDFPGKVVLQRGFGGSALKDVRYFADRVITTYHPKQIILYAGENDISGGATAGETYARFVDLFTYVRKRLPRVPFVYISMKPSPSRRKLMPTFVIVNNRIRQFLARQPRTRYVDVYKTMLGADGQPRGDLFKGDSLHMNERGYQLWASQLRPLLR